MQELMQDMFGLWDGGVTLKEQIYINLPFYSLACQLLCTLEQWVWGFPIDTFHAVALMLLLLHVYFSPI